MDGVSCLPGSTRFFEDFALGQRFALPQRTITAAMLDLFEELGAGLGGLPGARALRMAGSVLVLTQTIAGAAVLPLFQGAALLGLVDQTSRFLRAAEEGDTLVPALWVQAIEPEVSSGLIALGSTVHNQRRELLMEGGQRWRVRRRLDERLGPYLAPTAFT